MIERQDSEQKYSSGIPRRHRLLFDAPADHVQLALERAFRHLARVPDHDLLDLGPRRVGFLADAIDVDRHLPPAVDRVAEIQDFGLDDLTAALLRAEIGFRQEHLADRDRPLVHELVPGAHHDFGEEILRNLDVDAGAVAGLAVGIDRAPVPDGLQRVDPRLHHLAPRLAVQRRHQPDAASIVLLGGHVRARETRGVGVPGLHEVRSGFRAIPHRVIVAHRDYSAASAMALFCCIQVCICAAASRPSRIAQTTRLAPRTMSPAANTPGRLVMKVR